MNTHQHDRHPALIPEGGHAGGLSRLNKGSRKGEGGMTHPRARGERELPVDREEVSPGQHLWHTLLPVLGLTVLGGMLLLFVAALVLSRLPDPTTPARPVAYGILAAMGVLGGILAGRFNPQMPVPAGLASGGVLAACLLGLSWLLSKGGGGNTLPAALPHIMRFSVIVLHALVAYMTRPRPREAAHTAPGHMSRHAAGRR